MNSLYAPLTAIQEESSPSRVRLRWLDGPPPEFIGGATWGVPWPRGNVSASQQFALSTTTGEIPLQTWPLAYWPDGSIKWTAHAIGAHTTTPRGMNLSPVI